MSALREFANFITLNKANLAATYARLLAENGEPTDPQIGSARRLITAVAEACESGTPGQFCDLFKPQANSNFAPAEPLKLSQLLLDIEYLGQTLTPVVTNLEAGKFLWQMLAEVRATILHSTADASVALHSGLPTSAAGEDLETTQFKAKRRQAHIAEKLPQEVDLGQHPLYTLIDHIPDAIYAKDAEGRFILANLATARLLGALSGEEVIGKTDFDFFAPELAGQFRNDEQTLMQSGQPLLNQEEFLIDVTTGQTRWNLTSKIPRRDAQGQVIGLVGINRDITRRKQTEGMLRFSQFTLDHAATDITWIEPDARLFYVNESACRTLGYSREELLSMTIHDIQADPRSPEVWPLHWAELKQRGSFTFETQHRRKNGEIFPVEITVNYIEFDGKEYNCAFFRDITKRKGVEEELRYRVEFDRLITTISTQFVNLASKDIDYGINYALQTIGEFAGVDRSYVFLYSNDHTRMDNTHEWCASGIEPQIHKFRNFPNDVLSWSYQITNRGEVLYIPRVAELPPEASAEKEEFLSQDIQSLINVPMISGGEVVGFLGFDSVRQETKWSEDRITLLKLVGEMFVSALERRRLEQQIQGSLERRTRQVQIGTEIAQNMANVPALSDLFHLVTSTIQERFGYSYVQIYLFEEGDLVLQEGTGEVGRQMKKAGYKIPLSAEHNLAVRTVWSGEPVLAPDISQDPVWLPNPLLPETKAELAVPINLGAEILGVLDVQSDAVNGVDEEDQLVLMGLCGQIAIAIESTRRGEQMQAALVDVKQSQELLRSIIDATPDRIFIKDQEYRYHLVNREYANSLYLSPDDFIGKTDLELGMPEELVKGDPEQGIRGLWTDDRQVMDSGEPLFNQRVPAKAYGEVRTFNVVKVPLQDAEGRIWGVAGIARDVTEREQLFAETERRARREKTIREITEKMQSATSLEQLVKITARELGQRLGAGHAVVEMGIEPQTDNLTSFPNQSNNGH